MEVQKKNLGFKEIDIEYKYAWDWFSYHAAQRLIAFRFFLIIIGAVSVGYSTCLANKFFWPSVIISSFGVFISVAFYFLEIRNEELVNCGRHALNKLEGREEGEKREVIELKIRLDDYNREYLTESLDWFSRKLIPRILPASLIKHRFWLRAIYGFTFVSFLVLTILTLLGIIPN